LDHKGKMLSIEAGVGVRATAGADKLTFKLMVLRDLNPRRGHQPFTSEFAGDIASDTVVLPLCIENRLL